MNEKQYVCKVTLATKLKRGCWNVARVLLFRPFVTKIFRLWRIAVLRIFGAKISWNSEIYASAQIWAPWNLEMKSGSCIGPHVICYNQAKVILEEDSCLSQYAYICTAGHSANEINNAQSGLIISPVFIQKGAWVGTRAYINMGVVVGAHAVVGACACVFKDVEPDTVVGGNPAIPLK